LNEFKDLGLEKCSVAGERFKDSLLDHVTDTLSGSLLATSLLQIVSNVLNLVMPASRMR
jgi:hypothetical protein